MTVASSLGVSSCEPSGSSSEWERITGSSRVPDANIRERVIFFFFFVFYSHLTPHSPTGMAGGSLRLTNTCAPTTTAAS